MRISRWMRRLLGRERFPVDVDALEGALGYRFRRPALLLKGLTHRSYSQEVDGNSIDSNERLEFLGDSVLNMVVAHAVFTWHPRSREGHLTKLKSALVSKSAAEKAALKAGLDRFVLLSDSEEGAGGRQRSSILADVYEAVIGALFLDGGIEPARRFIQRTILDDDEVTAQAGTSNYKSRLLELTQSMELGHPSYRTVGEEGPDHDKVFTIEVFICGETYGVGTGKCKKDAQQMAAKNTLDSLENESLILPDA